MKSFNCFAVLFAIIFLFCPQSNILAEKNVLIRIEYIAPEGGFSAQDKSIIEKISKRFTDRGYKIGIEPEWRIIFNVYHMESGNDNKVIICYTLSQSLPKPIIDFGVENEVFYLAIDNKKELPNQDQKIREKVTSDYLHQFSMLINNKLSVIDASKIEIKLDKLVEEIDKQISSIQQKN